MKKFFLNKKLMAVVLCLCLGAVIIGVGIFAAASGGMPGMSIISKKFSDEKQSEPALLPEESQSKINSVPEGEDIVIEPNGTDGSDNTSSENPVPAEPIAFAAPERMMAVTLTAGKDYYTKQEMSTEDIQSSIESAIKKAKDLSANTVFLEASYDGGTLFASSDGKQAAVSIDMLKFACEKAREHGMFVYVIYDVLKDDENSEKIPDGARLSAIIADASALCKYDIDGVMLNTYTVRSSGKSYAQYLVNGGGMGYENYLYSGTEAAVFAAYDAIKAEKPSVAVGLAVDSVWANAEDTDGGSNTSAAYTSLYSGYADTKKFVENGLADFVSVKCDYSTLNKKAKFKDYTEWWNTEVGEDTPLYIFQYATKACTDERGWNDPSELSDQVIYAEKLSGFCGSIFDSLAALEDNPKQSTDALIKYLTENVDPSFLLTQLEMTRPSKTKFSTYEASVSFSGASDGNFDLLMNGEKVKRDSNGAFMITEELKTGLNTFEFVHKEKTISYSITRNVKVLKEISPLGNVTVGGGMSVTVTALAYEGSTVTASLGSTTVTLKPSTEADDSTDNESTYQIYTGVIAVPAAGSEEQSLGNIIVKGTWEGATETMEGAYVTVSAKAKAGGLVEVIARSAETFPSDTLNDLSDYDCYPLAKGTRDYVIGDEIVYVEGSKTYTYYNLQSGQRVYTSDVSPVSGELGGNKIISLTVSADSRYTYVTLETEQQVAYIAKYTGSAFTVDFQYTSEVPDSLALSCTPLFDSANWNGTKLELNLSTKGGFLGYYAYYEGGKLVFRFNNPTGTSSLSGVPIIVDVGHSALGVGALGYLSAYGEYEINLAVGKYLKSELESRGAVVYMMDTESQRPSLADRTAYASSKNPLVFVSIHCNSATTSTGSGTECFYFTRFSSSLADYFSANVAYALGTSNRGGMIGRYYVTRVQEYPAVLGELGFVSNESDYYKLIQNSYQYSIASGIADSISSYLGAAGRNGSYNYGTQSTNE